MIGRVAAGGTGSPRLDSKQLQRVHPRSPQAGGHRGAHPAANRPVSVRRPCCGIRRDHQAREQGGAVGGWALLSSSRAPAAAGASLGLAQRSRRGESPRDGETERARQCGIRI